MKLKITFAGVLLIALAAENLPLPFGAMQRSGKVPILSPQGHGFESAGVFNPAVIRRMGRIAMLYRAQDRSGTSRLGYAESIDGLRFTRRADPVLSPEAEYEKDGGVEDPRLVEIGGLYYLTYTGYNRKDAQLCLATSSDLVHWQRRGVILPANKGKWNRGWTKSGAILDRQINGHYWMYFMGDAKDHPGQMGVAYSDDLLHWTEPLPKPVLETRPGLFDARVAEPGPPPVFTNNGILLVYNGADEQLAYSTGWVLFDPKDPTRVLQRASQPIFTVKEAWERQGQVPNVVFVEGLIRERSRWLFYYGAADRSIGVATAPAN